MQDGDSVCGECPGGAGRVGVSDSGGAPQARQGHGQADRSTDGLLLGLAL